MRGTLSSGWKKRMREIEHLPSFPANLSYARGQWKMHLVRFSLIRTHTRACVRECIWGLSLARELLAETGAEAERLPLYEKILPHEYTGQPWMLASTLSIT